VIPGSWNVSNVKNPKNQTNSRCIIEFNSTPSPKVGLVNSLPVYDLQNIKSTKVWLSICTSFYKSKFNLFLLLLFFRMNIGVNFINILRTSFSYESALGSFSLVTLWLWWNDFGKKALSYKKRARKMLMKLTCEIS